MELLPTAIALNNFFRSYEKQIRKRTTCWCNEPIRGLFWWPRNKQHSTLLNINCDLSAFDAGEVPKDLLNLQKHRIEQSVSSMSKKLRKQRTHKNECLTHDRSEWVRFQRRRRKPKYFFVSTDCRKCRSLWVSTTAASTVVQIECSKTTHLSRCFRTNAELLHESCRD